MGWAETWREYPRIVRHFRGRIPAALRGELDPEDLVMDAALSLVASGVEPSPALLLHAARRQLASRLRRMGRVKHGGRIGFIGAVDWIEEIEGHAIDADQPARVDELLQSLDPDDAELIILVRDGYSVEAIAAVVGLSPSGVQQRLARIRGRFL
jgi:RNA polymerase sigma factor (sigma-70 family)